MFIDRAGLPFVGAALLLAIGTGVWFGRAWSVPFLVLAAFFIFFFRDPDRTIPAAANLVVSPADARIMAAGERTWPGAPAGEWQVVSMFLSPLDVHVNRTPVDGTVTRVEYHPGQFLPAYRKEAGQLNEWTEVWFDRPGGAIVARQIVGVLARRIVCRLQVGDKVTLGQRYGVMKFGSRMDVFLPLSAEILVQVGATVRAAETVIAVLH